MKELTGLILMAVLGTYYFCRKKTDRRKALFCKAAATSVPGILLAVSMIEGNVQNAGAGATLAAIGFYMVADVLGHRDVNTTKKHYAAIEIDRRKAAAKAVRLTPEEDED